MAYLDALYGEMDAPNFDSSPESPGSLLFPAGGGLLGRSARRRRDLALPQTFGSGIDPNGGGWAMSAVPSATPFAPVAARDPQALPAAAPFRGMSPGGPGAQPIAQHLAGQPRSAVTDALNQAYHDPKSTPETMAGIMRQHGAPVTPAWQVEVDNVMFGRDHKGWHYDPKANPFVPEPASGTPYGKQPVGGAPHSPSRDQPLAGPSTGQVAQPDAYEKALRSRIDKANQDLAPYRLDQGVIDAAEGKLVRKGYVPKAGHSGVTISTGYDIGQHTEKEIRSLGLPEDLTRKLLPYAAFGDGRPRTRAAARAARARTPLAISESEAEAIAGAAKAQFAQEVEHRYDNSSKVPFRSLPQGMQTTILDFAYQHGSGFGSGFGRGRAPWMNRLWSQLTSQDWEGAQKSLGVIGDIENRGAYRKRRQTEIDQIGRGLSPSP